MRYISHALEQMIDADLVAIEPLQAKYDDWHARCQAEIKTLVWTQPSVKHSFYKNSYGEIHSLSPWRLVDYWSWTKEANLADFVVR
jgi:4-hydroxyacetophenone monooxygenase